MKQYLNIFFSILLMIGFDQSSKYLVRNFFIYNNHIDGHYIPIRINSFFEIHSNWNTGISFGMLSYVSKYILIFINLFIIIGLVFYLTKFQKNKIKLFEVLSISLIVGGAIGNLIDRIAFGAVYDFLCFHYENFYWPDFNFADCFVVFGSFLLLAKCYNLSSINNKTNNCEKKNDLSI